MSGDEVRPHIAAKERGKFSNRRMTCADPGIFVGGGGGGGGVQEKALTFFWAF